MKEQLRRRSLTSAIELESPQEIYTNLTVMLERTVIASIRIEVGNASLADWNEGVGIGAVADAV